MTGRISSHVMVRLYYIYYVKTILRLTIRRGLLYVGIYGTGLIYI